MAKSRNRRVSLKELSGRAYDKLQRMRYSQSDYAEVSKIPALPRAVEGIVRVSLFGDAGRGGVDSVSSPLLHTTEWVAGPDYPDMEDNDLRGYLDGYVKCAWNQASQIHVRLGRSPGKPTFGEWELYRVLHRWGGLLLPSGAKVEEARLEIQVEKGAESELDVLLYAVNKDWIPGCGGQERNNISLPNPGEVWWNEVAFEELSWGLPGAGLSSDEHPDADTPATPLACARYEPGDSRLNFQSEELSAYVEGQITARKPLLLLLKLSDYLEDVPGLILHLYSANHGDDRNLVRRPRLVVSWRGPTEVASWEGKLLLEHGRSITLPRIESPECEAIAVSFEALRGDALPPALQIRSGNRSEEWRTVTRPCPLAGASVDVRVDAVYDPIPIGSVFTAGLRDTWVRTGPHEKQKVPWTFESPSGESHTALAEYVGDHAWRVEFVPDALGRWRYRWSQCFTKEPYTSAIGYFDVVPGDRENVEMALSSLGQRIDSSRLPYRSPRVEKFGSTFFRLERALMRHVTPGTFGSRTGEEAPPEIRALLDRVRGAFWGRPPRRFF